MAGTRKSYCTVVFYISTLKYFHIFPSITKFRPKIKVHKFGTKIALIWCFKLEFKKANVIFEISILEFVKVTAHKMKFSIKSFFSKCAQICSFLRIWSHLLKKSLMRNFNFCAVDAKFYPKTKNFKLGAKDTFFKLFFGCNVIKTIIKFLISTLEFVKL